MIMLSSSSMAPRGNILAPRQPGSVGGPVEHSQIPVPSVCPVCASGEERELSFGISTAPQPVHLWPERLPNHGVVIRLSAVVRLEGKASNKNRCHKVSRSRLQSRTER